MEQLTWKASPHELSGRVVLASGAIDKAGALVDGALGPRRLFLAHDARLPPPLLDRVRAALGPRVAGIFPLAPHKSEADLMGLFAAMSGVPIERTDAVVAVGGGATSDLAGLAAALWMRGIDWVGIPTTLLAQVDAGHGGKVGLDAKAAKNLIGALHPPALVVCDPDLLGSLPRRQWWSGMAEVAKYGLIAGGTLLRAAEKAVERKSIDTPLLRRCIELKLHYVQRDFRDRAERQILNLGHTVGHALEIAHPLRGLEHGEAVALGLRAALRISRDVLGLSDDDERRGQALLDRFPRMSLDGMEIEPVVAALRYDKKRAHRSMRMVLLEGLGSPRFGVEVPERCLADVIDWLLKTPTSSSFTART